MDIPKHIQDRIDEIKEEFGDHPNCYLVAVLLTTFLGGTIWYDNDHCVAQIDNGFYDRNGEVAIKKIIKNNYLPLQEYGIHIEKTLIESLINRHKDDISILHPSGR